MLSIFRRTIRRSELSKPPLAGLFRNLKTETISLETTDGSEHAEVRSFEEIPGPKRTVASMFEMYRKSHGFTKLYKVTEDFFNEYGPIFKENILGSLMVHVRDPSDIEKVFRAEGKYPERFIIDAWAEHRKRRNYFPGIVNLDGEEWHRVRHAVAPKMMRPKIVEENINNFNAIAKVAVDRLVKLKETCGPEGEIPDLEGELKRWSTETAGVLAFDARLGLYEDPPTEKAIIFINAVQDFFELSQKLLFQFTHRVLLPYIDTPTFKRFLKVSDVILDIGQSFVDKKMLEMKEMAEKGIDNNCTESQAVPLLTYLLVKNELSLQEINGVAIDVVFAGVDTTSNSVLWLLYNLACFPEIQEKLYQEVQMVLGRDGEVTSQFLPKLSYLKACLKESMRLSPVVQANSRLLDNDVVLSGYKVPAKTNIITDVYVTGRSDTYFTNPLEFTPERWLRENKKEVHAFASLPFGFGPRMCIGRRVAELEIYLLMCKILQRFRLEYHHEPVEPYQKIIAVPDRPVKIKFIDRL